MIKLPELDDKRFRQIFDEAVARIPTLTGEWTDYNPSDTGIMLLELLSAMTEMQNFYLDQVGNRFYEKYLELVTAPIFGETTEARRQRFAQESARIDVAVTTRDYEQLVLQAPFSIERAKVTADGGIIRVTVFRGARPLTDAELKELRAWLEPYRLLTARLTLEQADCVPVDIMCRVTLDASLGRENICRAKLDSLFRRLTREKAIGEPLNLDGMRSEILAIPEVTRIEALSVRADGQDAHGGGVRETGGMQVRSIQISFAE